MRKILIPISFFISICILISCQNSSDKQVLKFDLTKDTSLILRKNIDQKNIWGFNLQINGFFKDTVDLIITNQSNVNYYRKLISKTDTIYHGDWYADSIMIKFRNVKETIKDLKIRYEFYNLNK